MTAPERAQALELAVGQWRRRLASAADQIDAAVAAAQRSGELVQLAHADAMVLAHDLRTLRELLGVLGAIGHRDDVLHLLGLVK